MININSLTKNIKDGFKAPTGDSNRETPTKGALRFNTETGKPEIYAKGRGWRRASVSEISAIYTHDDLVAFYDASNADTTGDTSDQYYNDVSLLLHMNGANGSTAFTDSSSGGLTVTAAGNAFVSTSEYKFGGSSAHFDGASDAVYLSNGGGDFNFSGQSYWTAEAWFNISSTQNSQAVFSNYKNSSSGWTIQYHSGNLHLNLSGDGADIISSTTISTDTWYHLAIVNNNGTFTLYVNGTAEGTYNGSVNLSGSSRFSVGNLWYSESQWLNHFDGYIDEVRITNNVARYTADFTPQTREFYPGTGVGDITSNLNGVNNGATFETTSPANYSFSSGDYIQVPDDNLLDPVNITVLTWAYKSDWGESSPFSQRLISKYPNTGSSGWLQYLTGDSGLFKNVIYVGGTRYEANINATSISSGWHQVVFTYDGSSFKLYIDASLEQTNSNMSGDLSSNSTDLFIGNQQDSSNSPVNSDSGRYFNGKIAIVKIYDSALSEADITSEFNYHKSTFGL